MLRLTDIQLSDELTERLTDKAKQYNATHPDDPMTIQETAVMLMEWGIRYLDVSGIE